MIRILVTGLLLLLPFEAQAQKFSIAPQIGFYIPTQILYELSGIEGDQVSGELVGGVSFGARLGLWFGERFGIDVSGNYVPTTFKLTEGSTVTSQDAKLFNGAAQAVLFILPRASAFTVYLNGGVGVVSRGGVAFTNDAETTDMSGVIGGGVALRLGGVALSAGADLFAYSAKREGATTTEESFKQQDIQVKFGLGIPFGGSQIKR